MPESCLSEEARSILSAILALDVHLDIEATFFTPEQPEVNGWQKLASLEKMEEGDLGAAFFVAYTDQGTLTAEGYAHAYETVLERGRVSQPCSGERSLPGDCCAAGQCG